MERLRALVWKFDGHHTSDKDKHLWQVFILWPRDKGLEANIKMGFGFHSLLNKLNLNLKSLGLGV